MYLLFSVNMATYAWYCDARTLTSSVQLLDGINRSAILYLQPGWIISVVTYYRLDSLRFDPQWGQNFMYLFRRAWRPIQPPAQWVELYFCSPSVPPVACDEVTLTSSCHSYQIQQFLLTMKMNVHHYTFLVSLCIIQILDSFCKYSFNKHSFVLFSCYCHDIAALSGDE